MHFVPGSTGFGALAPSVKRRAARRIEFRVG
jgi:hypothetical protein